MNNILYKEIPIYYGKLEEGVYHGIIKDVKSVDDDEKIQVRILLALENGTCHNVFIRTPFQPKYRYDMILRLSDACKTRIPSEFIGKEVYVSVKINTPSSSERYENVVDIVDSDDYDEKGGYEITEKGYFIKQ